MQRNDRHPDMDKLDRIGKAVFKRDGRLPSVRKDSWQWKEWRAWFHSRGIKTPWSDHQPDDRFFTVVTETPPLDLDAALEGAKQPWGGKLRT